jgi:diguanylate cyclase (GGDEF)-like protein/putative nucleotidyltransferase with HDIG domain
VIRGGSLDTHVRKINRDLVVGWLVIVAVLFVSYCGEVLKGERTLLYLVVFMILTALPAFVCLCLYLKEPQMEKLRYYIVVGYFIMYLFSMITGSTSMVFSYILPMLSLLVLYHQPNLILVTGIASFIVNVISIAMKFANGQMTLATSKDGEIQLALLLLCFGGSYTATRLYDEITKENIAYTKMLDEKNSQIQKMTLQTITTIANTIDAKDEYTKGHSKRVSEYSAAIAEELGFVDEDTRNIRSIALLHDIGKIGVPDSVLNKPGRLTDEEYRIMKQHTVIGGEILKDIGMIPGIDIGAKYHHERYDGKGYPDGLKGEEIPFIARIICVADAYDAMTSNRVYRRHLSDEKVMQELNNSIGTQFDPAVARALIRLIKEKRLPKVEMDNEEEPHISDTTRILSRVMEKREQQITEQMLYDELTSLYNRSGGERLIKEALENGKGCFMLFNLDGFRTVNNKTGFLWGDIYLKVVAQCIQKMGRDVIVSRFGGDEFAVFFKNVTTKEAAIEKIEGFMRDIKKHSEEQKELNDLSVSAGIVLCTKEGEVLSDILLKADKALYYAKQQGGHRYSFYQGEHLATKEENPAKVHLEQLVHILKDKEPDDGVRFTYPEIDKIYGFFKEVSNRKNQTVYIMMFTAVPNPKREVSVEERDNVMRILDHAMITSIHSEGITMRYSSTQRIVTLMNISMEEVYVVAEQIMKSFYKMYDRREVNIYYDIVDLSSINEEN